MSRLKRFLDLVHVVVDGSDVRRTIADVVDFTLGFAIMERAGSTAMRQGIGSHFGKVYHGYKAKLVWKKAEEYRSIHPIRARFLVPQFGDNSSI